MFSGQQRELKSWLIYMKTNILNAITLNEMKWKGFF